MLSPAIHATAAVLLSGTLAGLYAEQTQPAATIATVPRLMRITSAFRPINGPPAPVESVTLSIYKDNHDPAPLWQETQNVALDAEGRYTVLMGASLSEGMPLELFSAGEPRWLGVQFNRSGEIEQPRVLLVSVPYALKAADADTLGGKPASAYVLSPPEAARGEKGDTSTSPTNAPTGTRGKKLSAGPDSVNSQSGTFDQVDVQFTDTSGTLTGYSVRNLGSGAASYSGMLFYDQNGAVAQFQGFNNSTHEYRINNIASAGSINFMIGSSSKFLVANSGNVGIGTTTPSTKLDVQGGQINASGGLCISGVCQTNGTSAVTRGITYLAGCDTCSVLADTDSQRTIYFNVVGPMTINSVTCFSDGGTPVINIQRDTGSGSPANVLSSNLTCSASGATSMNIASQQSTLNLNDKLDFAMMTAGGVAKRVTVVIKTTVN